MPTIRVELFEGRTTEQKAALASELLSLREGARRLGRRRGRDLQDIKRSDWATGGVLWSQKAQQGAAKLPGTA
ncbi:MAG: tautomerase family protein [Rubrivivax sp.]